MSLKKWQKLFYVKPILFFTSGLYLFGYYSRKFLYKIKLVKSKALNAKVISVGNLTTGGTGKTTVVLYLAEQLKEKGKKVAILTRGYKRKNKTFAWLSGEEIEEKNWEDFGDEPLLLAQKLKTVPVLVQKNRYQSGAFALKNFNSEYLLLDDGFQHWQLKRDLDILVIDCSSDLIQEKIFPLGNLREPISNLKRANLIILNQNTPGEVEKTKESIKFLNPKAPIITTIYEVDSVSEWPSGQRLNLENLKGKKAISFCGIGNPGSFASSLKELDFEVIESIEFSDHYIYSEKDLKKIEKRSIQLEADFAITTEKDEVRLLKIKIKFPIYILKIKLKIVENIEELEKVLL
jgi:tetraacyldisaccharide 4'-kinase